MDDLVTRLRNKDWLWTVPGALREEAADEIDRLTRERDEYARQRNAQCEHDADEIERLQHDIERHIAICGTQEQEIDRLTRERDAAIAALREIASMGDEDNEWDGADKFHNARDFARRTYGRTAEGKGNDAERKS